MAMEYRIVQVAGGVEPFIHGPFPTEDERDAEAVNLAYEDDEDGVFALDIDWEAKTVEIFSYSGAFIEERAPEGYDDGYL